MNNKLNLTAVGLSTSMLSAKAISPAKHLSEQRTQANIIWRLLTATFSAINNIIVNLHQRHVTLRDLRKLDDRMLNDIGLSRGQVQTLLNGSTTVAQLVSEYDETRRQRKIKMGMLH